jgi:hypothetical protein
VIIDLPCYLISRQGKAFLELIIKLFHQSGSMSRYYAQDQIIRHKNFHGFIHSSLCPWIHEWNSVGEAGRSMLGTTHRVKPTSAVISFTKRPINAA